MMSIKFPTLKYLLIKLRGYLRDLKGGKIKPTSQEMQQLLKLSTKSPLMALISIQEELIKIALYPPEEIP